MQSLVFKENHINSFYAFLYRKMTGKMYMDFGSPLNLVNVDEPKIENNKYVKIRTRMCGICGTDLSRIDTDK